ncbi:hypothetical protein JCM8547_007361 [Rhodosporidiobolus lusitaniae]
MSSHSPSPSSTEESIVFEEPPLPPNLAPIVGYDSQLEAAAEICIAVNSINRAIEGERDRNMDRARHHKDRLPHVGFDGGQLQVSFAGIVGVNTLRHGLKLDEGFLQYELEDVLLPTDVLLTPNRSQPIFKTYLHLFRDAPSLRPEQGNLRKYFQRLYYEATNVHTGVKWGYLAMQLRQQLAVALCELHVAEVRRDEPAASAQLLVVRLLLEMREEKLRMDTVHPDTELGESEKLMYTLETVDTLVLLSLDMQLDRLEAFSAWFSRRFKPGSPREKLAHHATTWLQETPFVDTWRIGVFVTPAGKNVLSRSSTKTSLIRTNTRSTLILLATRTGSSFGRGRKTSRSSSNKTAANSPKGSPNGNLAIAVLKLHAVLLGQLFIRLSKTSFITFPAFLLSHKRRDASTGTAVERSTQ